MKVLWLAISILLLSFTTSQAQILCKGVDKETAVKSMLHSVPKEAPHKIVPVEILKGPKFNEFLVIFNSVPPPTYFEGDSAVVFELEEREPNTIPIPISIPNFCAMIFEGDQCVIWGCLDKKNLNHLLDRSP